MRIRELFICVFWLAGMGVASAQAVITTFAGTDAPFTGDGQPALSAGLGLITGIATDQAGNVFFNDPDNHVVFRVGADGIIHVIAGNGIGGYSGDGGPATEASIGGDETNFDLQLAVPVLNGIAVDSSGNVFITTGSLVRRIDPNGIITTYAGGGGSQPGDGGLATNAALGKLLGIAVDHEGNVYFVERSHSTVRKVTPGGIISTIAGTGTNGFAGDGGSALAAELNAPIGITCDAAGNVYVAEDGPPGRIRKITIADGKINTVAGGGTLAPGKGVPPLEVNLGASRAVAVSATGDIYSFAPFNGFLIKFEANGDSSYLSATVRNSLFLMNNVPATEVFINGSDFSNSGLALDTAGNLYTSQNIRGLVRKIDTNGILTTIAGNDNYRYSADGTPAVSAEVRNPVYLTVGADGQTVYFLSTNGLRKIGSDGILNTVPAQSLFQAAFLIGLATDTSGNFYTLSFNTVVRLSSTGTVQTIVNQGGKPGSSGDQGPAISAQLAQPQGLAVDKAGNLFIADTGNYKIRMVTPNGVINTIAGTGQPGHTGDGGPALSATFKALGGMLADNKGGVYVIDGPYIRHVRADGTVEAVAGNGVSGFSGDGGKAVNASISVEYRSGMVLDAAGNLYFTGSDFENHVRRIAPDNTITTVAGRGVQGGFAGDGGPANKALFNEPLGLAMDSAGNLYVADSGNNRIRVILANAPLIAATPAQFTFQGNAGGAPPLGQYLTITGSIDAVPFSITQSPDSGWLTLSTSSGVTPRLIQLLADPSKLTANTYSATLTVQAGNATSGIPITVDFVVAQALPPRLVIDKPRLSFAYPLTAAARSELLVVSDAGSGTLQFQAVAHADFGGDWLSVSPSSGTATPAQSVDLVIGANPAGLKPGTYRGSITVSSRSTGDSQVIPVTMTISSATQAILLSHSGLTFTTVRQGGVSPPQTFAVLNIGTGAMNWTASTTTLSGGEWLSATPASGSSVAGSPPPKVKVTVNQTGLAPGRYYGLVRIKAPGAANTPHVITVILRVLPAFTDIGPVVTPSELVFTQTAGAPSPSSKSVMAYNIAATPKTYSSSAFLQGITLSYLPGQATLALNAPTEIVVQPVTSGLAPGVYRGNLTLQFSDGRVRDVKLHIIVRKAVPTGSVIEHFGEAAHAFACTPSKLVPTLTSIGSSFLVPAGWPVALQSTVLDDCGNPLNEGSVVVAFSNGDPPLSLLPLRNAGEWQATWNPSNTQSAQFTITVNAQNAQPSLQGSLQISGGLQTTSDAPQLSGVVSGASFASGTPLAPGAIVSVFGNQLADGSGGAPGLPLASTLKGATMVIAGESAPLFYASSGQINAAIPFDVIPNTRQQVLVERDSTLSVPVEVDMAPAQPAVFLDPQPNAPNQGSIFAFRNTSSGQISFLASPKSPATAGDTLVIYSDGLGSVNQTIAPGAGSPTSPAAKTNDPPQVTIGGKTAAVSFSGLSPGLVGVYQINAVVPSGITPGDQVPIGIEISGQMSPAATIALK